MFQFITQVKRKSSAIGYQIVENRKRTQDNYRVKRARGMNMDIRIVHGKYQKGRGAMLQDSQGIEDAFVDECHEYQKNCLGFCIFVVNVKIDVCSSMSSIFLLCLRVVNG